MHFLIVISSILYSISKSNTSFSMEFSIAFLSLLCILYIFRKCEAGKTKNEKNIRILMLILTALILLFHYEILFKFYL